MSSTHLTPMLPATATDAPVALRMAGAIAGELAGNTPRIAAAAQGIREVEARPPRPLLPLGDAAPIAPSWTGRDAEAMVTAALEEIADQDGRINAVWTTAPDARSRAHESRHRQRGGRARPLEGVPFLAKDIIDTAGLRTTSGTRWLVDNVPATDAPAVSVLKAAGAIMIGKSATFELACGGETTPFGFTRNPHDLARTTGGSSSGSAAAVAAGYVPFALGSDTSGSIRIPAGYCGVVGFKPTRDAVSTAGVFPMAPSLDVVGPLAADVVDAAAVASVLSGQDWRIRSGADPMTGARVGVLGGTLAAVLDDQTRLGLSRALTGLVAARAEVVHVDWEDAWRCGPLAYAITMSECAEVHSDTPLELVGDSFASRVLIGRALDPALVDDARSAARQLRSSALDLFADFDLLISAGATSPAPRFDDLDAPVAGVRRTWMDVTARTMAPWSLLGFPVLSLPAGRTPEGLPVAVQLITAPGRDAQLLALARELEQAMAGGAEPGQHEQIGYGKTYAEVG